MQAEASVLPDQIPCPPLSHSVPWLFSRACLNCSHPAGLYCGITNKIAWMTPKVRRARLQAKVASLFYSPKMKALVHMLYSPLPPNYRSFHLSFRVSQLEILSIHKMQVFPSSRCFLSFTTSAELKSYCTQKLTHKCIIVVLRSSALIMHFKTLSSQGFIQGIQYHRSIKSTVCFWYKRSTTGKNLQLQRESMYVMDKTINLILKILANKRNIFLMYINLGGA